MTENEAIKVLANHFDFLRESWKPYPDGKVLDAIRVSISSIQKIQQYQAIGTVEECQQARERQRAKKVSNRTLLRDFNGNPYSVRGDCPNCGNVNLVSSANYCNACGKKLDWSE